MDKVSFKIYLVTLIISVFIAGGSLYYAYKFPKKEPINVQYVKDPNVFYTIERCVNKYINLIIDDNQEAVYSVIDDNYKKENNITLNNVSNYNLRLNASYSFVGQKMLEDGNNSYYVKGYLLKNNEPDEDFVNERIQYSIIIKLKSNGTYSVIPDEGKVEEYFDEI